MILVERHIFTDQSEYFKIAVWNFQIREDLIKVSRTPNLCKITI